MSARDIERLAVALDAAIEDESWGWARGYYLDEAPREKFVRALLQALREPTPEMIGAGADAAAAYVRNYEAGKTIVEPIAAIIFRAQIDQLLAE